LHPVKFTHKCTVRAQVGSEVARRAKGLGCKVIAYDPYASAEMAKALGVTLMPLDECLAVRVAYNFLTRRVLKTNYGPDAFG
jgi:hypothetical protein